MKIMKLLILVITLAILTGCASTIKYEKQPFTPIPKVEPYVLSADPFTEPPVPIYLKKGDRFDEQKYVLCPKEEAEVIAFTSKELNKITLRIAYLKDLNSDLVKLVNIHIQRENVMIDIITDQNTAKEIYRELLVDLQNASKWKSAEKVGLWTIIIGQLVTIFKLAF